MVSAAPVEAAAAAPTVVPAAATPAAPPVPAAPEPAPHIMGDMKEEKMPNECGVP